uniref:Putative secreted protein n=1 Tax=Anopheles marajoara TaxID=58244 RepID=A0A2M4CEX9_9DIPT
MPTALRYPLLLLLLLVTQDSNLASWTTRRTNQSISLFSIGFEDAVSPDSRTKAPLAPCAHPSHHSTRG